MTTQMFVAITLAIAQPELHPQNYQSNYAAVGSGVTTHDDVANTAAGALVLIVALNALKADRSKQ
jgi:hypothetical protein